MNADFQDKISKSREEKNFNCFMRAMKSFNIVIPAEAGIQPFSEQ